MPRCSLATSSVGFSSAHVFMALRRELFDMFDHSSSQNVAWSSTDLFLCQSALNPHRSFWWIFVEQCESCHPDPRFRQWLVSINLPMIIDGRLLKYIKACFRLSLHINETQRYGKIVLRNLELSSSRNMIPKSLICHPKSCRAGSECRAFVCSSEDVSWDYRPKSSPLCR